jgi:hypothetical protein
MKPDILAAYRREYPRSRVRRIVKACRDIADDLEAALRRIK